MYIVIVGKAFSKYIESTKRLTAVRVPDSSTFSDTGVAPRHVSRPKRNGQKTSVPHEAKFVFNFIFFVGISV